MWRLENGVELGRVRVGFLGFFVLLFLGVVVREPGVGVLVVGVGVEVGILQ